MLNKSQPWLELDLNVCTESILREAEALSNMFVVDGSSGGRGSQSLCIHGISDNKAPDATPHGYASESGTDHKWTEIAPYCPNTVSMLNRLPVDNFYRVRFMRLEPGGFILPHSATARSGFRIHRNRIEPAGRLPSQVREIRCCTFRGGQSDIARYLASSRGN